ncbi:polyol:NADP oxidoreductase [Trypanosoma rangeli]|uniref:mannitol 2-dehydrogenase n=1 Tax=Trypanosoma rangeli TaxID=5698 RepID=A0A3R7KUA1_TRYRA|nr:polyol:NADP oxidoreductase [Trypanosoma rangeli]RNF01497.1 polyol:NADP oxidoreductase [Trypanosoma rangeli]|eukprot:RNF01497.1 polyol:NADP oxidoreductase [Trypanosoma rangeli]
MHLSEKTIDQLPPHVESLGFDRSSIRPGILHFGVGQFCRGHLMLYVRDILRLSAAEGGRYNNWGVVGVNVVREEEGKRKQDSFRRQSCLYTLTLTSSQGKSEHCLMGSMLDYIYAPEEQRRLLKMLVDPCIAILSLTITEGGYNIDEKRDVFDCSDANVQKDLHNPHAPITTFGYIVEGLRRRREKGVRPFTVMSCDNLRHNGDVAKKAVLGYARAVDADLAAWIEANVMFPNSMVDRITPATTPQVRDHLNARTGICDAEPVLAEDFCQWVIEDKFCNGVRPPWDRVGATFSNDVAGYEQVKVRILNSSHIMLTWPGLLLGLHYVHEALGNKEIYRLVEESLDKDILPTLRAPEGLNLVAYKEKVLSRFMNIALGDQLLRVAGDGCSKVQVFWTNNLTAILQEGRDHARFAFGLAAFLEALRGRSENGKTFPVFEPKMPKDYKMLVMDRDLAAPLKLPAFDAWRMLDHAQLDRDVVMYRRLIQERGVLGALPWKVRESAQGPASRL